METCPICGQNLTNGECFSNFCNQATDEELVAFRSLKEGEYGIYPCPGCGDLMEGNYNKGEDGMCTVCYVRARNKTREDLLRMALNEPDLDPHLARVIGLELKKQYL